MSKSYTYVFPYGGKAFVTNWSPSKLQNMPHSVTNAHCFPSRKTVFSFLKGITADTISLSIARDFCATVGTYKVSKNALYGHFVENGITIGFVISDFHLYGKGRNAYFNALIPSVTTTTRVVAENWSRDDFGNASKWVPAELVFLTKENQYNAYPMRVHNTRKPTEFFYQSETMKKIRIGVSSVLGSLVYAYAMQEDVELETISYKELSSAKNNSLRWKGNLDKRPNYPSGRKAVPDGTCSGKRFS